MIANPQIDPNTLYLRTEVTAGLVFATTGIAVVIGIVSLIGRLCNVKHDKGTSRVFFFLVCYIYNTLQYNCIIIFCCRLIKQDMLYVVICFLGFCAAGVLGVFPAMDWSRILSSISSLTVIDPFNLLQSTIVSFESIRNSLAATAVSDFIIQNIMLTVLHVVCILKILNGWVIYG